MENIKINNFLVIKDVNIDINDFTLFIGPQASGKSIIAKLIFFFREFLHKTYLESIEKGSRKPQIQKDGKRKFSAFFISYAWDKSAFEITYTILDEYITISNKPLKSGNYSLSINFSTGLSNLHSKLKNTYNSKKELWQPRGLLDGPTPLEETLENYIVKTKFNNVFSDSLFIPAARSFYSTIKNNVFSFLTKELRIDPFLTAFGYQLEKYKNIFGKKFYTEKIGTETFSKVELLIGKILKGRFRHSNQFDWIVEGEKVTELSDASSGQQESMPLLIMLCSWALYAQKDKRSICFIEEPEAHLFPSAQKDIMTFFGYLFNIANQRMLLTTHSPYIIAALNNLILANDVKNKLGEKILDNVVDSNTTIPFEATQVYLIHNGRAESILNHEERLINASALDNISYDFEKSFDILLDLLTEDK